MKDMTEAIGRCMACGKKCFHSVWVCEKCYNKHPGLRQPFSEWLPWARELKRLHENDRGYERRAFEREADGYSDRWKYDIATIGEINDDAC